MRKNKILTLAFVGALMLTGFFGFTSKALASESVMYPDSYSNSDYANPERYTPNADDLSRFVYSDEMEAKESVVVQDYVYYMEDGEVVVEPISGVSIDYKGKVSYSYGGYTYTVGDFTVNGYQAYCLEHDNSTPGDGTDNDGGNPYNDPEVRACLYYGWGGQGQINFDSRNQGIVVTSLVLDELYTGENNTGAISNCPQYKELENKARNGMPSSDFTFSDTTLTTTVNGGTQTSQTTKMNGSVENKVSFKIPSEVTFHNKTTGHTQKGGTVTIKGGDSFYFTAPSNYETDYNSGSLKGTIRPVNPIVVKMDNSSLQDLGYAPYKDPVPQAGFTVQFKNYQQKVTVNHIDQRTGEVITQETYMKNTGDNYTYSPRNDLKKDGIPYTPVSTAPATGTVGTTPITINFYYTLPVVEVALDSVKIPTAPASEGLDVYVRLILDDVYDSTMTDTVNPNFTLAIYEGTTKITSKEVSSSTFDDSQEVILEVPSSMLNVDEMNNYTVKIEGYDSNDVHVNAKEITIEGYTASEETIEVNASTTQQELAYEGVAGTYEKYGQSQQTAYESFSIPNITQLGKEKSGFGFELPISFYYNFDDPSGQFASQIEAPELTMNVPNEIVDTTYIEYETDGVTSEVPFEKTNEAGTESSIPYTDEQAQENQKKQDIVSNVPTDEEDVEVEEKELTEDADVMAGSETLDEAKPAQLPVDGTEETNKSDDASFNEEVKKETDHGNDESVEEVKENNAPYATPMVEDEFDKNIQNLAEVPGGSGAVGIQIPMENGLVYELEINTVGLCTFRVYDTNGTVVKESKNAIGNVPSLFQTWYFDRYITVSEDAMWYTYSDTPGATRYMDNNPDHGTCTVYNNSSCTSHTASESCIHYKPSANYHGSDYFEFHLNFPSGNVEHYDYHVTVNAVDDNPTSSNKTLTMSEDTVTSTQQLPGADVDGDEDWVITDQPNNGTLTTMNTETGQFVYDPNANFNGTDSFQYKVKGDNGEYSAIYTCTITVTGVDDNPTSSNMSFTMDEDTSSGTKQLPGSDIDGDEDWTITDQPNYGTLTTMNTETGQFVYEPDPNFYGVDTFQYKVKGDNGEYSSVYTCTITVNDVVDTLTGLKVTNTTSDSITVAWDDYSGEEEFNVYLNDELYGTAEVDATSYTIDYLDPNTTYTIGIAPISPDGTVAPVVEVAATTLAEGDIQPITGLEVTEVTTNSITVEWDSYSGEEKFNVYVNGELYDEAGFGATSYSLEGLDQAATYTIGIAPVMSDGKLAPISEVTATTLAEEIEETPDLPQAPMNVTATSSEYAIELSWTDGSYADSYNVYLNGDVVTNVTSTSYTFGNLTPNTTYTVGVSSVNAYGESEISKLTVTTLTIPTNMTGDQTYQLPHVWCEEMSGELFTDQQRLNNDPRITDDLIDGGNKFYTPIWCDLGQYPISVTNEEPIGANEVNIEINYVLDVYAQMYGTVDSETIEDDHIIWRPVDVHNPFPNGKPDNWTDEDVEWLMSNNFVW